MLLLFSNKKRILFVYISAVLFNIINVKCSVFIYDCRRYTDNETRSQFCDIHDKKLSSKTVRIYYGLYRQLEYLYTPKEYSKKMIYDSLYLVVLDKTKHAFIGHRARGGCLVHWKKHAKIFFCKDCNSERSLWIKNNRHLKPFPYYGKENSIPSITGCIQSYEAPKRAKH